MVLQVSLVSEVLWRTLEASDRLLGGETSPSALPLRELLISALPELILLSALLPAIGSLGASKRELLG